MRPVGKFPIGFLGAFLMVRISICMCAPINYDMRLTLNQVSDGLEIVLKNNPSSSALIPTPIAEWQPGTGGVGFKIWTADGKEVIECAMVDYQAGFQKKMELKPSEKIAKIFDFNFLREHFCLSSRKYFFQSVFHNEVNGEELSRDILSNPILIDFPEK